MKVIVDADDFGCHPDINRGTLEAHRHGVVTSASLMVNFEASAEAVEMAAGTPGLPVGLHFNVSSGHCAAPVSQIPSLVDTEGRFRFDGRAVPTSISRWQTMIGSDSNVLDQIEREFWAQIERFRGWGLEPAHMDIHHYLALIHIDLFAKYVDLANQLAVPFRGLCYPMMEMLRVPQSVVAEMETIIGQSKSVAPRVSLSNLLGSRPANLFPVEEYERLVQARLHELAMAGVDSAELVTHPALVTEAVRHSDDYSWARELETALVNSFSFARFLNSDCYSLVAHADLE